MDEERLIAAVRAWQDIALPTLQISLDAQGLEIVENQKESLLSRKKLAEATKDFKKVPDEEKLREFRGLLKAYQSEIDAITRRSKTAETAFLNLYKVFAEAPDPAVLFDTVADQAKQIAQINALQSENQHLREELTQTRESLNSARKDEGTIMSLKGRLTKYEAMLEEMVTQKVEQKENEMKQAMDEKIRIYKETEYSLQRQLSQLKDQMMNLQTTHQVTQARLVDHSEKYDEEVAAKLGEVEIIMVDLDRANLKIAQLERDNSSTARQADTIAGGTCKLINSYSLTLYAYTNAFHPQSELATHSAEAERLRLHLKESQSQLNQRIAEQERDLAVKILETKELEAQLLMYEDYDEIKRELEIVKSVEFDGIDAELENNDTTVPPTAGLASAPLERLLLSKNKRLQAAYTDAKVQLAELQAQISTSTRHIADLQSENDAHKKLIKKLEEDLAKLEEMRGQPANRAPNLHGAMGDALTNLINGTMLPPMVSARLNEGAAGPDTRGETSTIVPILTSQRDRYRQRNTELEEQLRQQISTISDLRAEVEKMKDEQVKLYERLRYAQSFSAGGPSSAGQPDAYQNQSGYRNTHARIPIYESRYETALDPFSQFHQQEKARRVKEMHPLDRVAWISSRMILGNRYLRSGFVIYCMALHALVWWAVFGNLVGTVATPDKAGGRPVGAATPGVGRP
ncbi:CASP C terminal-domain-containing protein [Fimicolochytrium jonesii]|uniref:CASP C terminal-domain-containing protein n=1 Tax=Fimicolochytrium jonesii TaxID=1396493 RepID=UPI0022FE5081|nr:CASP C terminal-domain-containing protein [Fimicolochytrium jonesii]KAI8817411.1 CASP C terminal-domain-containing protein [Fimicolochytrium jonesii]